MDEQLANQLTKIEQMHQQLTTEQDKMQLLKQLEKITNQELPKLDDVQPPIKKDKGKQKAGHKRQPIKIEIIDNAVKKKAKTAAGKEAAAEWYAHRNVLTNPLDLTLINCGVIRYGTSKNASQNTDESRNPSSTYKTVRLIPYLDRVAQFIPKQVIADVHDPRGDGNCGFRSLAKALLGDEKLYKQVKSSMLTTYHKYKNTYYRGYDHKRLPSTLDPNSSEWYINFECSQIAADTYGQPITIYGRNSYMFLPCHIDPAQARSCTPVILFYVGGESDQDGNHIVWVKVKKDAVIKWPSIDPFRKAIVTKEITKDPWYPVFPNVFHHTLDPGAGSSRSVTSAMINSYYVSSDDGEVDEILDLTNGA